jgi:hypothetical protein
MWTPSFISGLIHTTLVFALEVLCLSMQLESRSEIKSALQERFTTYENC